VPNDWAEFEIGVLDEFDNVVISPGPGTPERPADFGICTEVIEQSPIPVLGVCLGHQGIAQVHGGVVAYAPEPWHGRVSRVSHRGTGLFAGISEPFSAVRYHSLAVTDLPSCLKAIAWSEDGVVQALQHKSRPQWGVQFHPESIASEEARTLLRNFAQMTVAWNGQASAKPAEFATSQPVIERDAPQRRYILDADELPQTVSDEQLFTDLFGSEPEAVWLDGNLPGNDSSRFSIMGAPTGPLNKVATASVPNGTVEVRSNVATNVTGHEHTNTDESATTVHLSGFLSSPGFSGG
jgi:para-aminobenzoate synthetase